MSSDLCTLLVRCLKAIVGEHMSFWHPPLSFFLRTLWFLEDERLIQGKATVVSDNLCQTQSLDWDNSEVCST